MAHSGLDIPASMAVMNLKPGFVTPFGMRMTENCW